MDYIILNNDGSIKEKSLKRYIQQGSSGVKYFIGINAQAGTFSQCQAVYNLPNKTSNTELGTWVEDFPYEADDPYNPPEDYSGETCNGWVFTLTTDQTTYYGLLFVAIRIIFINNYLFVSFPFTLVINETGVRPDTDSGVTIEELDSYLENMQELVNTYTDSHLENHYVPYTGATRDIYLTDHTISAQHETAWAKLTYEGIEIKKANYNYTTKYLSDRVVVLGSGDGILFPNVSSGTFALVETTTCLYKYQLPTVIVSGSTFEPVIISTYSLPTIAGATINDWQKVCENAIAMKIGLSFMPLSWTITGPSTLKIFRVDNSSYYHDYNLSTELVNSTKTKI